MLKAVIIIDDNEADRYLARRMLTKAGVAQRIIEMPHAIAALELLRDEQALIEQCGSAPPPLVLLLDINMPRMNGFQFLDELKGMRLRGELCSECLVVMMFTSSSNEKDVQKAATYEEVKHYINKPIDMEEARRIKRIALGS